MPSSTVHSVVCVPLPERTWYGWEAYSTHEIIPRPLVIQPDEADALSHCCLHYFALITLFGSEETVVRLHSALLCAFPDRNKAFAHAFGSVAWMHGVLHSLLKDRPDISFANPLALRPVDTWVLEQALVALQLDFLPRLTDVGYKLAAPDEIRKWLSVALPVVFSWRWLPDPAQGFFRIISLPPFRSL